MGPVVTFGSWPPQTGPTFCSSVYGSMIHTGSVTRDVMSAPMYSRKLANACWRCCGRGGGGGREAGGGVEFLFHTSSAPPLPLSLLPPYVVGVRLALGRAGRGGVDDVQVFVAEEAERDGGGGVAVVCCARRPRINAGRPRPRPPSCLARSADMLWPVCGARRGKGARSPREEGARRGPNRAHQQRRVRASAPHRPRQAPSHSLRRCARSSHARGGIEPPFPLSHLDTDDAAALAAAHADPPHEARVPMRDPSGGGGASLIGGRGPCVWGTGNEEGGEPNKE